MKRECANSTSNNKGNAFATCDGENRTSWPPNADGQPRPMDAEFDIGLPCSSMIGGFNYYPSAMVLIRYYLDMWRY
jgi:hypothetical protein